MKPKHYNKTCKCGGMLRPAKNIKPRKHAIAFVCLACRKVTFIKTTTENPSFQVWKGRMIRRETKPVDKFRLRLRRAKKPFLIFVVTSLICWIVIALVLSFLNPPDTKANNDPLPNTKPHAIEKKEIKGNRKRHARKKQPRKKQKTENNPKKGK